VYWCNIQPERELRDEMRNAYKDLVGKPGWTIKTGGLRCRLEDSLFIYLKETGHEGMNWVHLTQDSIQWRVFRDHSNSIQTGKFCGQLSYC
jgi:hypothetical protein